ncbi:MAG: hypothetical protein INR69_22760 [Mucilaginibacter polytrichastri]|nr:hypothetical protein [Mucilaginibacter polytrichastri]
MIPHRMVRGILTTNIEIKACKCWQALFRVPAPIELGHMKYYRIIVPIIICGINLLCSVATSHASKVFEYSQVGIYENNRFVCRGLKIGNDIITAAHCFRGRKELGIRYFIGGQVSFAKVSRIKTLYSRSPIIDIAIFQTNVPLAAEVDGIIAIGDAEPIENFIGKQNFSIELKAFDANENEARSQTVEILPMNYLKGYDDIVLLSLDKQSRISLPDPKSAGSMAFSINMHENMIVDRSDLICQGQSGSPVFARKNDVKYLIGILIRGQPNGYYNNVLCGKGAYALRLDGAAGAWIRKNLDPTD